MSLYIRDILVEVLLTILFLIFLIVLQFFIFLNTKSPNV